MERIVAHAEGKLAAIAEKLDNPQLREDQEQKLAEKADFWGKKLANYRNYSRGESGGESQGTYMKPPKFLGYRFVKSPQRQQSQKQS